MVWICEEYVGTRREASVGSCSVVIGTWYTHGILLLMIVAFEQSEILAYAYSEIVVAALVWLLLFITDCRMVLRIFSRVTCSIKFYINSVPMTIF